MTTVNYPPSLFELNPRETRTTGTNSIQAIDTTTISNGVLCYCIENSLPYRFNRTSTTTPDGNYVIQPTTGPGRWLLAGGTEGRYGLYASRPPPGQLGVRYISSDGGPEWLDDGTAWRPILPGKTGKQVPLVASFASTFGAATFTDAAGVIIGQLPDGFTASGLVVPKSATTELIVHPSVVACIDGGGGGIVIRDSATQNQMHFAVGGDQLHQLYVTVWTDDNTFSVQASSYYLSSFRWLRFVDDGTDFHFYVGNGTNWTETYNVPRGAFVPGGGDQIGLGIIGPNSPTIQYDSFELTP